jgi:2-C-methyl-D-erythritol 4-phosphate cytidylyltransferase
MQKRGVIIVAGGKGLRMGADIPKQFIEIGGLPILMHTINVFYSFDRQMRIVLVLPEDQQTYWEELCHRYSFSVPHIVAKGGKTRFDSVQHGLIYMDSDMIIGVHDGVRPFVSRDVISDCYKQVEQYKAVIPVIDVVETVRCLDTNGSSCTVDRNKYKLVQTPQVFDGELLKKGYQQSYKDSFTDDASVVEALGYSVHLVQGNRENIKITTPYDLKIAEALL